MPWVEIAKELNEGKRLRRTDGSIKNRYNTTLKRKGKENVNLILTP